MKNRFSKQRQPVVQVLYLYALLAIKALLAVPVLLLMVIACISETSVIGQTLLGNATISSKKLLPLSAIGESPQIYLQDQNVKYIGKLTPEGLFQLKKSTKDRWITSLTIASTGGEISIGIDFGTWVFDNNLDVIVEKACMSSCANYIFPAGRRKVILPGAVVAWHGSATHRDKSEDQLRSVIIGRYKELKRPISEWEINNEVRLYRFYLRDIKEKQEEFYKKIEVDEYVTRIGNVEYGVKGFFFMPVEDMAKFGIHNVMAPKGYENTNVKELKKGMQVPIICIKLKNRKA
jgi:hypothetical protein